MARNTVEFEDVTCTAETTLAICCRGIKEGKDIWIPKSQVHDDSEVYE